MRIPAFANQPWVMGVVNVTPDSFSDGGKWLDADAAIAHGMDLAAAGARLIDVGGESTRPGAHRVDATTECDRVVPVIKALAAEGIICSVDTSRAVVAAAAVEAGAAIINDVSGGMADPDMVPTVADARVPWIIMHWRGPSDIMNSLAQYTNAPINVRDELLARIDVAVAAGIDETSLVIDPGLGFAKTAEHNWQVLRQLDLLTGLGLPVLVGASRKRFLGALLADPIGTPRPADGRETATAAISLLCAEQGAWAVRVHDVTPTLDALATLAHGGRWSARPAATGVPRATEPLIEHDETRPNTHTRLADRRSGAPPTHARPTGDRIALRGLVVRGYHGVFDHEKRNGQDFVIDISLARDHTPAARTDSVDSTVNYAELAQLATDIVAGPPRDLIETVAAEIADAIVAGYGVEAVEVTVHKPQAPIAADFDDVAVTVRRDGRTEGPIP